MFDLASELNATDLVDIGLPPLNDNDTLPCGSIENLCTREQLLKGAASQRPATGAFQSPFYSNTGFVLLGMVLEKMTGMPWDEALKNLLFDPLGLKDTYTAVPTEEEARNAMIPGGREESYFGTDIGIESA